MPRLLPLLLALLLLPTLASGALVEVTNANDSGAGSFRAALETVKNGDRIEFRIPAPVPASGWFTIHLQSLLPYITVPNVTIDGGAQTRFTGDTNPFGPEVELDGSGAGHGPGVKFVAASGSTLTGLAINRFSGNGVVVERGDRVAIQANYLGVDPTGTEARPNGFNGALFIGATQATLSGNILSGNAGNGVYVVNSNVNVTGNRIGAGRTTAFALGNGANGIDAETLVTIVESNVITFNRDHGITVAPNASMVEIVRNEIWGNGYLSIDLGHDGVDVDDPLDADRGANGHMNAPVLTSARASSAAGLTAVLRGNIHTVPKTAVLINFYASPYRSRMGLGEARVWIGGVDVTTDASGFAEFSFDARGFGAGQAPFVPGGYVVATAYAPNAREGTSEMSVPIALEPAPRMFEVTNTADAGPGSLRAAIEASNAATCTATEPCRITFHLDDDSVIDILSPLPAIANEHSMVDGSTVEYWTRTPHDDAPDVVIRGSGLQLGTAEVPLADVEVREIGVRGAPGDGVVAYQRRVRNGGILISRVDVSESGGNGIVLYGGSGSERWNESTLAGLTVSSSTVRDNRGNGIVIEDDANTLADVRVTGNAGDGILVRGLSCRIAGGFVASNGGAGVATSADARAVYVDVATFANGGLGIDRGTRADAPEILSARWDDATRKTIVRVRASRTVRALPEREAWTRNTIALRFFASSAPDPSGFGEGERFAGAPVPVTADEFETAIDADLRGQWITATRLVSLCYFDFGCGGADASELSNAVRVE